MNNLLYQLKACQNDLGLILAQDNATIANNLNKTMECLRIVHRRIVDLEFAIDSIYGKPR